MESYMETSAPGPRSDYREECKACAKSASTILQRVTRCPRSDGESTWQTIVLVDANNPSMFHSNYVLGERAERASSYNDPHAQRANASSSKSERQVIIGVSLAWPNKRGTPSGGPNHVGSPIIHIQVHHHP